MRPLLTSLFLGFFLLLSIDLSAQLQEKQRSDGEQVQQQRDMPEPHTLGPSSLDQSSRSISGNRMDRSSGETQRGFLEQKSVEGDLRDRDSWKKDSRTGWKSQKDWTDRFSIGIGFTRDDFILDPGDRFVVFTEVPRRVPDILVISEKIRLVDPACLFPEQGYYTLFLPRDDAVAQEIVVSSNDPAKLCDYLKQFIVPEVVALEAIKEPLRMKTLAGTEITVENRNGTFLINGVRIIQPNAFAEKGVMIHVTDKVIGRF